MTDTIDGNFRFGGYTLDLRRVCLRCGERDVKLRPKSFEVLCYLVRNAGRLVSKDELIEAVWPNLAMTDDSLTRCVSDVRGALQDKLRRIIKTVPGFGYLMAAAVSMVAPGAPAAGGCNLPRHLAALIGRDAELAELQSSLAQHRLVTLAGPGGIGKTRLAIELGWRMSPVFGGGVRRIDLAKLDEPGTEDFAAALGPQPTLLIFDNCEYRRAATAGAVDRLLAQAPQLSILVTSQEALGLPAERVHRLQALAIPDAMALFVERARAADQRFGLDRGNAAAVVEVCRRLEGIPLALEMAAARLPLLGIEGLRAGLDERLRLLNTCPRALETRHRSLRDMAAWSYGLLTPADQQVLLRLSTLAGSFSRDDAVAIGGIDTLDRLVAKSLVMIDGPRFRLLETMRLFAAERLAARPDHS